MTRIVLTGGPGAGKTVISAEIARKSGGRIIAVPEAATQVYSAAGQRWNQVDEPRKRQLQRQIYHLQIEQEARFSRENPGRILLLDRGTVDGSTYWPHGQEAFWEDVGTTLEVELARYDRVILLQSAAAIGIYDGEQSNIVRFEDATGAIESDDVLKRVWSRHKDFRFVPAKLSLDEKIAEVLKLLSK